MAPRRDSRGRFVRRGSGGAVVTDRDLGWSRIMASIRQMGRDEYVAEVGWFVDEVATYMLVNEFGSSDGTIPERPFFRATLDANQAKYTELIRDAFGRMLDGEVDPDVAFVKLVNAVRTDLIRAIQDWSSPPNEPSTIREKGSSSPLVDTGQAQRTITWRVGRRGQLVEGGG